MQTKARPHYSTNVRLKQRAIQAAFVALGPVPAVASRLATKLWMTPPRAPLRPEQQGWLDQAERVRLDAAGARVAVYAWGSGPVVLLSHGWGGHAGQLTPFVADLVDAGFRAVAFDAPGHGATQGGVPTVPHFAATAHAISSWAGGIHAVVAHSMGAGAMAYAMSRGLGAERAVFMAPAASMSLAFERFTSMVKLQMRAAERMRLEIARDFDLSWDELDFVRAAPSMRSRLLVFHDAADREVPHAESRSIVEAWPAATLVTTEGLGHHRLLRDPKVVRRTVEFVAEGAGERRDQAQGS